MHKSQAVDLCSGIMSSQGSLVIIGTGIKLISHMSLESTNALELADVVLYLSCDPVTPEWIRQIHPDAISLHQFYEYKTPRRQTYERMIEAILEPVRSGRTVCAVFYGHPGVFVYPSHRAIKIARAEGHEAVMLPAISAEDCLIADLGVDPGYGFQMFEATDFLVYERVFDPRCALVLWQVGVIGCKTYDPSYDPGNGLAVLCERLLKAYPPDHKVYLYEASQYAICGPRVQEAELSRIEKSSLSAITTMFVPPVANSKPNLDITRSLGWQADDEERCLRTPEAPGAGEHKPC